jgi:hypothetical protein
MLFCQWGLVGLAALAGTEAGFLGALVRRWKKTFSSRARRAAQVAAVYTSGFDRVIECAISSGIIGEDRCSTGSPSVADANCAFFNFMLIMPLPITTRKMNLNILMVYCFQVHACRQGN